jgi:hypothetical protein
MKKLHFAVLATAFAVLLAAPAIHADEYYIVRDNTGQVAVTDGLPGYGWSIAGGPFSTVDAAQRAMGTGISGSFDTYKVRIFNHPLKEPKYPKQQVFTDIAP